MASSEVLEKVRAKLLRYISFRPRSEYEAKLRSKKYLKDLGVADSEIDAAIAEILAPLVEAGLVSDVQFVQYYLSELPTYTKPRSIRYVRNYFMQRGVASRVLDEELANMEPDVEYELATKAANRRLRKVQGMDERTQRAELIKYLASKGYPIDVVTRVIDTILGLK